MHFAPGRRAQGAGRFLPKANQLYDRFIHSVVKMKWYEYVTNASPLFGEYVEEILGNKMSRALPNHVVMVPSDQAKNWMVSF